MMLVVMPNITQQLVSKMVTNPTVKTLVFRFDSRACSAQYGTWKRAE